MSNFGKWEGAHRGVTEPRCYGDQTTYQVGAEWLSGLSIEDWGCGLGGMRLFSGYKEYVGVDGSASNFADRVVDLVEYRSNVEGIFMRHVLEHDRNWKQILRNAVESFQKRMVLILFTPLVDETRELTWNEGYEVPDIAFSASDLLSEMQGCSVRQETYKTDTQYGVEHVFFLEKSA